ncbi:hypothetical protein RGQ29_006782 [Quercus rubra]|uniref:WAT1-related protein n=1 Tax=Quercus rubra TaxID=3512 RepID=A0AAN7E7U2_QUERU|nr:hypothetical protein RGQ29_006782 [Quercus rubra]KAK4564855.1 hypothetical protein RGQ29_006782 [Quercus rubra]
MILIESVTSSGVSALVIVVYEHVIATILLAVLAFFLERNERPPLSFKILCYAFLLGLLQITLCQLLMTIALQFVSSSYESIGINLVPSVAFVMALFFRQEKLKFWSINGQGKIWGLVLSAAGALVLVLWEGPVLLTSRLSNIQATSDGVIGLIMIVVGVLATNFWNIMVGIVVTGLSYYVMTWSIKKNGPVFTSAFNPLLVVFSFLLQTFVLGDSAHLGSIVGAVSVIFGLYLILWAKANDMEKKEIVADDSVYDPLIQA